MSEVFEGFLVENVNDEVREWAKLAGLQIEVKPLESSFVIYRVDPRETFGFSSSMDELASRVSEVRSPVVLVRYDSRASFRASIVYRDGSRIAGYGPDDELFVPLDDDGEPMTNVAPLPATDLDSNEEYETAVNAIEIGLRKMNGPKWSSLLPFIASQ